VTASSVLLEVLEDARSYGFLGPGPIDAHLESAQRFLGALEPRKPGRILDLGSGGGAPALPLAVWLPEAEFVLLDAMERRTQFLTEAVARLGVGNRVVVVRDRAETAGRLPALRGSFDTVTARSFGPPAVTAECGAPFLRVGGILVVSEPPETADRWPASGLDELGMRRLGGDSAGVAVLEQESLCPDRYPRRSGIPTKRPIF
jgi:16S rRNA (guanine527-N7)-methyltransferase